MDTHAEARSYGAEAKGTLDDVCTQQLDGECEVYKAHGLNRVVTVRYLDGKGTPGTISVMLSRFESRDGALAFYTKRVVADGDPAKTAPAALEAGGLGTLGSGIAYVWKGQHVAELSYANELEAPEALRSSARACLPPLAKALGDRLPGGKDLPKDAALLPGAGRVPQGFRYEMKDVLGIPGAGPGAIGYYAEGERRFRQLVLVRADEDSAKDVIATLEKQPGAKEIDDAAPRILAVPITLEGGLVIEWVLSRVGAWVVGVGDEDLVVTPDQSAADREHLLLNREQKLTRLRALAALAR